MKSDIQALERACPPCNQNCNQGDDCPAREQLDADLPLTLILLCGGGATLLVSIGMAIGFWLAGRT